MATAKERKGLRSFRVPTGAKSVGAGATGAASENSKQAVNR